MSTIRFVTWDGGGNLMPALGAAAELRRRGHEIRVLGHPPQRGAVEAAGFHFEPYAHARPWSATTPADGLKGAVSVFAMFNDSGPGRDLAAAEAREPADLTVIDCMTLGALKAASDTGIHYAVLVHTFYQYLAKRWRGGPIGLIAALKRQRPLPLWSAAGAVLVASLAELDPAGRRPLPRGFQHIGPVLSTDPAPRPAKLDGSRILVSLSTVYYPGQARTIQSILDAVADLPVRVTLTAGGAIGSHELKLPPNCERHSYLHHADVMPEASLVVGHGGHGTTMLALAHDLPLVIVPLHPMLDQPMIGRVIEERGAAKVVRRTAQPDELRTAIEQLRQPGPHRAAAARLGAAIRATDAPAAAADRIESLVAAGLDARK